MKHFFTLLFVLQVLTVSAQTSAVHEGEAELLLRQMQQNAFFQPYLDKADELDIQIILTKIERDPEGKPLLTRYTYRLNGQEYFNPASMVKWPLILLTMEKVNILRKKYPSLSIYNKVEFMGNSPCSPHIVDDPLAKDRVPRLGNYIKEMLLASDDNAYNRIYDFLGQEYINSRLAKKGYDSLRVILRFAPCSYDANRTTPAVCFYDDKGKLIYRQASATNPIPLTNPLGRTVVGGKDYSRFNRMSLQDMNELMLSVFIPEAVSESKRFDLTESDRNLLYKYTALTPGESEFPPYQKQTTRYHRHLKKYLYYGKNPFLPDKPGLEIHNMVGESHGTLSDVAYFVNRSERIEFMLATVINTCGSKPVTYTNYHYTDVGQPFLKELGRLVYQLCLENKL